MPEIAEVKLISDNIRHCLQGNQIINIEIMHPTVIEKWINRCVKGLPEFNAATAKVASQPSGSNESFTKGMTCHDVKTKGKFCWIVMSDLDQNPWYAMVGFGMSGNIRPEPTDEYLKVYRSNGKTVTREEYLKHCHLKINYRVTDSQNKIEDRALYYHDIRRFGSWTFTNDEKVLLAKLAKLGKDLLTAQGSGPNTESVLSDAEIIASFRKMNSQNICKALMGQELIAGVGNYVKAETLYSAKIYPLANIKDIPDTALLVLYRAIQEIAKGAYLAGGASLYTYTGMNGDKSEFKETLKVYGRTQDPLGNPVERIPDTKSPDKRSIFWVPAVQTYGLASQKPIDCDNQPIVKKKIIIRKLNFLNVDSPWVAPLPIALATQGVEQL